MHALSDSVAEFMQTLSDRLCAATGTPTVDVGAGPKHCPGCQEPCGQCEGDE